MAKKPAPFNNPFGALKLEKDPPKPAAPTAGRSAAPPPPKPPKPAKNAPSDDDSALFLEAIGEVEPVRRGRTAVPPPSPPAAHALKIQNDETEALTRLAELVSGDGPFELSDTDEFVEGHVHGLEPRVLRKLKQGEFSTQAHVDLHGLTKDEAKDAVARFLLDAHVKGLRCVLVVHGRGLHSKDQVPVLKAGLQQWLARGRAARHVLAFCTARPSDGGLGAMYVLLRR